MTGTAVLVVDRLGRRPLLLGGVSGMVNKGCPVSVFLLFIIFFLIPRLHLQECKSYLFDET